MPDRTPDRLCHHRNVARIVAANLGLVDRLVRQDGVGGYYLADEVRSRANWTLFVAADRIASRGMPPDAERNYISRAIRRATWKVRRDFGRPGRTLVPLADGDEGGWDEPEAREAAPDVDAELRELLALGRLGPPPLQRHLSGGETDSLLALIAADPSRSNAAIARAYRAATRIRVYPASVRYHRKKLGLPPSAAKGGYLAKERSETPR